MSQDVEETIDQLKAIMDAESDADLARKLRIDRSTIASWKARKRVPARFSEILTGESAQFVLAPPSKWGSHEEFAFRLALFRLARAMADVVVEGDFRTNLQVFAKSPLFWKLMVEAQKDLVNRQNDGQNNESTALALLIHDDLEQGAISIERDRALIARTVQGIPAFEEWVAQKLDEIE